MIRTTELWLSGAIIWGGVAWLALDLYRHWGAFQEVDAEIARRVESARLALANPGREFFVLKAVGGSIAPPPPVEPIKVKTYRDQTDEIPW